MAQGRHSGLLHLRIAAIVAGCAAASCSQASADSAEIGRDPPLSAICKSDESLSMVAGLHLTRPVDYLSWEDSGQALEAVGTPCKSAEEHETCPAALATLRAEASTSSTAAPQSSQYYLYTRGDAVGLLVSEQEILEFLGAIDTVNEAAVVLSLRYHMPGCAELSVTGDGYVTGPRYLQRTVMPMSPDGCRTIDYFAVHVSHDGTSTERPRGWGMGTCPGRRPSGLIEEPRSTPSSAVGDYFARLAELELAAVGAFAEIERALVSHGAPAALIERCRAARRDEVRHTALMTELACRYGATPDPVRFVPKASHTLLELALENAREGTSRELFGAAIAAWQARSAGSLDTRAGFAAIARDEAEHAQLSLDLAAWLSGRLSEEERTLVERERERSFQELEQELEVPPDADLCRVAGVPSARDAQRLLRTVRAELT